MQWIYTLDKEQLINRMVEYGLPTTGTIDELRNVLNRYVKDNPHLFLQLEEDANDSLSKPMSLTPVVGIETHDNAKVITQMRQWGCQFQEKDPFSFLERIEELQGYGLWVFRRTDAIGPARILPRRNLAVAAKFPIILGKLEQFYKSI